MCSSSQAVVAAVEKKKKAVVAAGGKKKKGKGKKEKGAYETYIYRVLKQVWLRTVLFTVIISSDHGPLELKHASIDSMIMSPLTK